MSSDYIVTLFHAIKVNVVYKYSWSFSIHLNHCHNFHTFSENIQFLIRAASSSTAFYRKFNFQHKKRVFFYKNIIFDMPLIYRFFTFHILLTGNLQFSFQRKYRDIICEFLVYKTVASATTHHHQTRFQSDSFLISPFNNTN